MYLQGCSELMWQHWLSSSPWWHAEHSLSLQLQHSMVLLFVTTAPSLLINISRNIGIITLISSVVASKYDKVWQLSLQNIERCVGTKLQHDQWAYSPLGRRLLVLAVRDGDDRHSRGRSVMDGDCLLSARHWSHDATCVLQYGGGQLVFLLGAHCCLLLLLVPVVTGAGCRWRASQSRVRARFCNHGSKLVNTPIYLYITTRMP